MVVKKRHSLLFKQEIALKVSLSQFHIQEQLFLVGPSCQADILIGNGELPNISIT